MKKIFLIMIVALAATASTMTQKFFSDVNYSINAGLSISDCNKVFNEVKAGPIAWCRCGEAISLSR